MSPYTVTTKRPDLVSAQVRNMRGGLVISRVTVATLDEARDYVHQRGATFSVASIGESGGTVGPLPDGTVIEVERQEEVR